MKHYLLLLLLGCVLLLQSKPVLAAFPAQQTVAVRDTFQKLSNKPEFKKGNSAYGVISFFAGGLAIPVIAQGLSQYGNILIFLGGIALIAIALITGIAGLNEPTNWFAAAGIIFAVGAIITGVLLGLGIV